VCLDGIDSYNEPFIAAAMIWRKHASRILVSAGPEVKIHLIAVGRRMPDWVEKGVTEYQRRMPAEAALRITEIAPGRRGKRLDIPRIVRDEGEKILAAIPSDSQVVALDVRGKMLSTPALARWMDDWLHAGRDVALLVGGPDGLSDAVRDRAERRWSLSSLTFPHPLVRILVAEQLYRAWSILKHHPYHRE